MTKTRAIITALAVFGSSGMARAEQVGNVDVYWLGNDIIVEAFADPDVDGVTCHVAYFERGLIDRLQKGNWFEDPSNSAISCRQTGPITVGDISRSDAGESIFSERRSIIWKSLSVKRIFDTENQTLFIWRMRAECRMGLPRCRFPLCRCRRHTTKRAMPEGMMLRP